MIISLVARISTVGSADCSSVLPTDRTSCGGENASEAACEALDCCWQSDALRHCYGGRQRLALQSFYDHLHPDPGREGWLNTYGWGATNTSYCAWNNGKSGTQLVGVECNETIAQPRDVISIILPGNNLYGTIPTSIADLTMLRQLNVFNAYLDTTQKPKVGLTSPSIENVSAVTSLEILEMSGCFRHDQSQFKISAHLSRLTNLKVLGLNGGDRQLTGSIPPEFILLTALKRLVLQSDSLDSISPDLCPLIKRIDNRKENRYCMPSGGNVFPIDTPIVKCCDFVVNSDFHAFLTGDQCPTCLNGRCGYPQKSGCTATKSTPPAPGPGPGPGWGPGTSTNTPWYISLAAFFVVAAAIFAFCLFMYADRRSRVRRMAKQARGAARPFDSDANTAGASGGGELVSASSGTMLRRPLLGDGRSVSSDVVQHAGGAVSIPSDIMLKPSSVVVGRQLRAGGGGAVHLGVMDGTTDVVLKTLFSQMRNGDEREFWREAQLLWSLRHPNVVRIFGVVRNPTSPAEQGGGRGRNGAVASSPRAAATRAARHLGSAQEEDRLFMVMEYCECGSLRDDIASGNYNRDDLWLMHAQQLARTIAYLHGRGVVHRDIKPSNVLVDCEGNVKICDLGIARLQQRHANRNRASLPAMTMTIGIGTPSYMPPEAMVFEQQALNDDGADAAAAASSSGGIGGTGDTDGTGDQRSSSSSSGGIDSSSTMSTGTSSAIAAVAPPSNFAGFSQEGTVIDGRAWDIFSLGMTLLYAWRGTRWWPKLSPFQMANALAQGHRPTLPSDMPSAVAELIQRMWATKPGDRPTAVELCETLESTPFEEACAVWKRFEEGNE